VACRTLGRTEHLCMSADRSDPNPEPRHLIVFGGAGYVGSNVCKEALAQGYKVVAVNRSGAPNIPDAWVNEVDWIKGDAFESADWEAHLKGAVGTVSSIGAFGSNEFMERVCGDANMAVIEASSAAGIDHCVFVSAAPAPKSAGVPSFILKGYLVGKRKAEDTMHRLYPETGVILRPGFVYGDRPGPFGVNMPLQLVGKPLEFLFSKTPLQALASIPALGKLIFEPPVSVENVAATAVAGATGKLAGGIYSHDTMVTITPTPK